MSTRVRKYVALLVAIVVYYIVHEGAHLLAALCYGVFRSIRFVGVGMQVVIEESALSETQLGVFCLVGALATFVVAWMLVWAAPRICRMKSKLSRAIFYYISLAMLFVDPVYLSVCYNFFGGGDMNGISMLMPELLARSVFALLFVLHILVFFKYLLPCYKAFFAENP